MEFLKFIRSVEDFLYELMTWLIFYPRTLWLACRHPLKLTDAAAAEMDLDDDKRFAALISPPLFLMLTVLSAWLVESALHIGLQPLPDDSPLGRQITASPTNLLAFRVVLFSVFPLVMAVGALWREGRAIDRRTLRRPFYLQCLLAGPFALAVSVAVDLARLSQPAAAGALGVVATVWFVVLETAWFRRQPHRHGPAAGLLVAGLVAIATVLVMAVAMLLVAPQTRPA